MNAEPGESAETEIKFLRKICSGHRRGGGRRGGRGRDGGTGDTEEHRYKAADILGLIKLNCTELGDGLSIENQAKHTC